MRKTVILFSCMAMLSVAHAEQSDVRAAWNSNRYFLAPLPAPYPCDSSLHAEPISLSSVLAFTSPITTTRLKDFACRFGVPSRHLRPRSDHDDALLIYDLTNGDSVALSIAGEQWTAIALVSKTGRLIQLIK